MTHEQIIEYCLKKNGSYLDYPFDPLVPVVRVKAAVTIVLKEIDEPIGSIAAVEQRDDIKMVHIGYCIGRKWWYCGYTSEALAELIRFFFENVGINRIESRHDPRNPNSGKVMLKCGLKYEGTMRQDDINNQGICDSVRYAILAEDYCTNRSESTPKAKHPPLF